MIYLHSTKFKGITGRQRKRLPPPAPHPQLHISRPRRQQPRQSLGSFPEGKREKGEKRESHLHGCRPCWAWGLKPGSATCSRSDLGRVTACLQVGAASPTSACSCEHQSERTCRKMHGKHAFWALEKPRNGPSVLHTSRRQWREWIGDGTHFYRMKGNDPNGTKCN